MNQAAGSYNWERRRPRRREDRRDTCPTLGSWEASTIQETRLGAMNSFSIFECRFSIDHIRQSQIGNRQLDRFMESPLFHSDLPTGHEPRFPLPHWGEGLE